MRVVWAMVGTAFAIAISCSEPEEAGGGTFQAGGAAGSAGGGSGGKGGGGGSATGGTRPGGSGGEDGGAAGSSGDGSAGGGAGGESPCECSGDPNVPDPEVQCSVPLELLCLPDDPFGCPTALGVAIANVADHCDDDEFGTRADCDDGTTELEYWEPSLDSTHRLVFDDRGTLVGRYYYGSAYFGVYTGVCGGAGDFDFLEYQGGELPTGNCEPSCSLCADGDLPTCEP